jgi:hypothetical protein
MATHKFKNKSEALEAGYRQPGASDKDVSGPNSFGYVYEDEDGKRTVDVWLSEVKNKGGGMGAVLPMFPPGD